MSIRIKDGWTIRTKGNAKIYMHPAVFRAITVNFMGIFYNGQQFKTLDDAKRAALEAKP